MSRNGLPADLVRLLEYLPHEGEPSLHGLANAPHALDVHVADAIEPVLPEHFADLVHLAPEPEYNDVREVRMPRVARQRAAQDVEPFAGRHATARLVRQRDDPINVRELRQGLVSCERVALEGISDQARGVGAAVYGCQDADVVACRDTPVRTDDPLERGRLWNVVGRLSIHAIGVVLREVAHTHIVDMHMLPWSDGLGREANNLIVLPDRLTQLDPAYSHLVPGGISCVAITAPATGVPGSRVARATTTLSAPWRRKTGLRNVMLGRCATVCCSCMVSSVLLQRSTVPPSTPPNTGSPRRSRQTSNLPRLFELWSGRYAELGCFRRGAERGSRSRTPKRRIVLTALNPARHGVEDRQRAPAASRKTQGASRAEVFRSKRDPAFAVRSVERHLPRARGVVHALE